MYRPLKTVLKKAEQYTGLTRADMTRILMSPNGGRYIVCFPAQQWGVNVSIDSNGGITVNTRKKFNGTGDVKGFRLLADVTPNEVSNDAE